ncbi:hypothetical protein ACH5RR_029542 [Cinchona calisaya]|uniref:Maturase K n=1 Tax=Cinchona calisaya TaxID=153742 RepID=A0ABD2YRY5_9GENT
MHSFRSCTLCRLASHRLDKLRSGTLNTNPISNSCNYENYNNLREQTIWKWGDKEQLASPIGSLLDSMGTSSGLPEKLLFFFQELLEKRYSFALREHPDIDSDGHTYLFSRSSAEKAFKRLFQSLTNLKELLFFWCASINMVFPVPYQEGNNPSQSVAYSIPIFYMSLPHPLTRQEQDSQKGKSGLRFSDIASYIRER